MCYARAETGPIRVIYLASALDAWCEVKLPVSPKVMAFSDIETVVASEFVLRGTFQLTRLRDETYERTFVLYPTYDRFATADVDWDVTCPRKSLSKVRRTSEIRAALPSL